MSEHDLSDAAEYHYGAFPPGELNNTKQQVHARNEYPCPCRYEYVAEAP